MRAMILCLILIFSSVSVYSQTTKTPTPWDYYWQETLGAGLGLTLGFFAGDLLVKAAPGIEFILVPQLMILGGTVAGVDLVGRFYNVKGSYLYATIGTFAGGLAVIGGISFIEGYCSSLILSKDICSFLRNDLELPGIFLSLSIISMGTAWGYNQEAEITNKGNSDSSVLPLELKLFSLRF